ncbi:MAG: M3 family metallopeptidase [Methanomassiliicoccales archaeon]|nr:M3 family metallopeptidase [Methanomassiliicoccales archaeon]
MLRSTWRLEELMTDPNPAAVARSLTRAGEGLHTFQTNNLHGLSALDDAGVGRMLRMWEEVMLGYDTPLLLCKLRRSLDGEDPAATNLYHLGKVAKDRMQQVQSVIEARLARRLADGRLVADSPALEGYSHYLERIAKRGVHDGPDATPTQRSCGEEGGWLDLYGGRLARLRFPWPGSQDGLSMSELEGHLGDPDPDRRCRAYRELGKAMGDGEPFWTRALLAVCASHLSLRGRPASSSLLGPALDESDIEESVLRVMMRSVKRNMRLSQRYYGLKADLLGLGEMRDCDVLAPMPFDGGEWIPLEEGAAMVIESFSDFRGGWGDIVLDLFDRGRVDSEPRRGKEPGASCDEWLAGRSAFVMCNYHGRIIDVFTLAHELGHAVHAVEYSRAQTPLNCQVSPFLAETFSTMAELLLGARLLRSKDRERRMAVLGYLLDSFAFTMLNLPSRTAFELEVFDLLRRGVPVTPERIAEIWKGAWESNHGGSARMLPESAHSWPLVSQFFDPRTRFHAYPYIFGELMALGLLRIQREQGDMAEKVTRMMSQGSSAPIRAMTEDAGIAMDGPRFWEEGFDQASELLAEFESLARNQ